MTKQDEVDFFNYLITPNGTEISPTHPGRDKVEAFPNMPVKRKYYLLDKWWGRGIWEVGISNFCGWFTKNAVELFNDKVNKNKVEKLYAHIYGYQLGFIINKNPNGASGEYIAEYELGTYQKHTSFLSIPKKHLNVFHNTIDLTLKKITSTLVCVKKDLEKVNGLELLVINIDEQVHQVLKMYCSTIKQMTNSFVYYYLKVNKSKVANMYKAYYSLINCYLKKYDKNKQKFIYSDFNLEYDVRPNNFTNTLSLLNTYGVDLGIVDTDVSELEDIDGFKLIHYVKD